MFDNYNRNRAAREQQERRIRELEKYSRRSTLTGVAAELLTTRLLRQLPDQIRAMLRGRDVSRTTMPDLIGLLKRSLAQLDAASLSESECRLRRRCSTRRRIRKFSSDQNAGGCRSAGEAIRTTPPIAAR
jgi:hypothetical protein